MGRVLVRYDNWSEKPVKVWEIYPKFEWHDAVPRRITPASFDFAGELLCVIEGRYAVTTIYHAATGVELADMPPGPEVVKFSGWIDIPYGINAMRRPDGEYLLLAEEDGRAKNLLYLFQVPNLSPPESVRDLRAEPGPGRITLHWPEADHGAGYVIERMSEGESVPERLAAISGQTSYRDESAVPEQTYAYRVIAVGWGGVAPPSQAVRVKAEPMPPQLILYEDFEGGESSLGSIEPVPMPEPALKGGGRHVGRLGHLNHLNLIGGRQVPENATRLVIEYDRLYRQNPGDRVHTHYTRQFVRFAPEPDGEVRHGQGRRFTLGQQAGEWHRVRLQIEIPDGARRIIGGELANIAERAEDGYDNPVYIDNLKIFFE